MFGYRDGPLNASRGFASQHQLSFLYYDMITVLISKEDSRMHVRWSKLRNVSNC